jgi:hypothetical protein
LKTRSSTTLFEDAFRAGWQSATWKRQELTPVLPALLIFNAGNTFDYNELYVEVRASGKSCFQRGFSAQRDIAQFENRP